MAMGGSTSAWVVLERQWWRAALAEESAFEERLFMKGEETHIQLSPSLRAGSF